MHQQQIEYLYKFTYCSQCGSGINIIVNLKEKHMKNKNILLNKESSAEEGCMLVAAHDAELHCTHAYEQKMLTNCSERNQM